MEKATARLSLNVEPETKIMLRKLAESKGETMTQTVERLVRGEALNQIKGGTLKN